MISSGPVTSATYLLGEDAGAQSPPGICTSISVVGSSGALSLHG
jgi:hypothetical protein